MIQPRAVTLLPPNETPPNGGESPTLVKPLSKTCRDACIDQLGLQCTNPSIFFESKEQFATKNIF